MILVTLGTQDKSFHRLLEELDRLIEEKIITEEVVVQAGTTVYSSSNMEIFDLIPVTEFQQFIQKADLIITHGGVGTIITALKQQKKVIAVARLKQYGEHTNDHQLEIIDRFDQEGYLIGVKGVTKLQEAYLQIEKFNPKKFQSNTSNIIQLIQNYLDTLKSI